MYQYVNIFFMEIYSMLGTVEVYEGAAVCFLTCVAWHAYTVQVLHYSVM